MRSMTIIEIAEAMPNTMGIAPTRVRSNRVNSCELLASIRTWITDAYVKAMAIIKRMSVIRRCRQNDLAYFGWALNFTGWPNA